MTATRVLLIALISAAVGAVAGGAYVAHRDAASVASPKPPPAISSSPSKPPPAPNEPSPYPEYLSLGGNHVSFQSLRERASRDPAFLQNLLQRFRNETEPAARGELLSLLNAVSGDDVLRFALSLAASTRAQDERDGLDLLRAYSIDRAEVRQAVLSKLEQDGDPQRTAELVGMLTPTTMPSEDAAPVVAQLSALTRHADPAVRAEAVLQLAQWDDGAQAEDVLHRALLDASPQVRGKAIAGVQSSHLRSDRLKEALLDIAADPASSPADRGAAAFALQDFRLNRAEYGIWRRAQIQADRDSGEGG
ncbi:MULTISPECIES: HEAT repeat domain-containing protein [unclassified Lysobacter]|uniref:HEAT repeat domain-containing protein n=1 Tax=unclassified Lysobacter TaxID=2635362 RepID=UPI001BEC85D1|nr:MULTISPECIES: HEAT repeat domain-containing protein [unclassified Lysobacter]MBT2752542.1 HEAT repeat domain-containing protein [Lysobacter sp. ISL-50]MBT2776729.1 HEAT repeat domain-containing protein [Lysobacter sp. ISL-54]MBT2780703.1 HEAT repeat domain-containing protein [Lysobacter sp. ISL-52]